MTFQITFSLVVNYFALVTAVWLGWYVITRSPKNLVSWLTSLSLWSVGGLFLNIILAIDPLPPPSVSPFWLRIIFPFWPKDALNNDWGQWLQGWQVVPAIVLWHHATMLLRPGAINWWRRVRIIFGYLLALFAIWLLNSTSLILGGATGTPTLLNTLKPGPLYVPFLLLLTFYAILSLINIFRTVHATENAMQRRQLMVLGVATMIAGLTAPIAVVSTVFNSPIPQSTLSILLATAVILIGYGVARYSALIEGRTIRRDFFYNALAMSLVVLTYSFVTWISVKLFNVPAAAFVFVIILVIITHNLIDVTRRTLDFIFFRRENQQFREQLRKFANQVDESDLSQKLSGAVESICTSVRAIYGLLFFFEGDEVQLRAGYNPPEGLPNLSVEELIADDFRKLESNQYPNPLSEAALLLPLYNETTQIGAIVLGRPVNSTSFSETDIELILNPCDQLAETYSNAQKEMYYLRKLSQPSETSIDGLEISVVEVERTLRNIYDYAVLGESPLAGLTLINTMLSPGEETHLDRGKAVYNLLIMTLDKLRPGQEIKKDPPSREWHPFLILHGAYIEDKPNREIMSQLFISEGTFNRTRRSAIRSVTKALEEMESQYH